MTLWTKYLIGVGALNYNANPNVGSVAKIQII